MGVPKRSNISVGAEVGIERKVDQGTGRITTGVVEAILTGSEEHPHGIKVRLRDGTVGRVKRLGASPGLAGGRFADLASKKIPPVEDSRNEFKEFYQYDPVIEKLTGLPDGGRRAAVEAKKAASRERIATAVCAMGNKDGGFVYVGVRDDGTPAGLQKDLDLQGFADYKDAMANHMADSLKTLIRDDAFILAKLRMEFRDAGGSMICIMQVLPSDRPLFLHGSRGKEFYVRGAAPRSERLDGPEMARYLAGRFRGPA